MLASKWANPFRVDTPGEKRDATPEKVVAKYRVWLLGEPELLAALPELRGKDLARWCAPERCHAEVLRELANR